MWITSIQKLERGWLSVDFYCMFNIHLYIKQHSKMTVPDELLFSECFIQKHPAFDT